MKEILGFIVLTSPLFLVVLWTPVAAVLGVIIGKKISKRSSTIISAAVGILVFLVLLLLPVTDEIAGNIYFKHLCKNKAKAKFYQTVELSSEYWDKNGTPKFYVNWDENLGKQYPLIYTKGIYSTLFNIDNAGYKFVDIQSGNTLGEVINFRHWGGWLRGNFSPHNTAESCNVSGNLINEIFIPLENDKSRTKR